MLNIDYTIQEVEYNDLNKLENKIENIIIKTNQALKDSANEITTQKLIKNHKMKFNGWWDNDIKQLYTEYKNAKKNYNLQKTTLSKILYKRAKKAFRNKQEENKSLLETKKLIKTNSNFKINIRKFHRIVDLTKNEKISTTIDVDMIRPNIFKLFNGAYKPNIEIEQQNKDIYKIFQQKHKNKIFNCIIAEENIINILNGLKNNKAIGINKLSSEMFKYGINDRLISIIKTVIEHMINHDIQINDFNIGLIKLLVKDNEKDPNDPDNLRPLTISDTWAIIYEKIILEELEKTHENCSKQFGFKKNSSCDHAVFTLKETSLYNKRRKKPTFICAIDTSKAFDKINRSNLWAKLIKVTDPWIVRSLYNYYNKSKAIINIENNFSQIFETTTGCKQGGPLSPRLFAIYVEELSSLLDNEQAGIRIGKLRINNLFYADDLLLLAMDELELNSLLLITENYGLKYEIKFNHDKTMFMI